MKADYWVLNLAVMMADYWVLNSALMMADYLVVSLVEVTAGCLAGVRADY